MDAHRRYAEEPEPSWYAGQRSPDTSGSFAAQNPGTNPYDTGTHERPSGAFRIPDQRPADPYPTPAGYPDPAREPGTTTGGHAVSPAESGRIRVPVRGPEYPAVRPSADAAPAVPTTVTTTTTYGGGPATSPGAPAFNESPFNEPTSMVPMTGTGRPAAAMSESAYTARRPVSAVVFAVATVILAVPAVLLLVQATFVDDPAARGVVPAVLLTLGLPLTGTGLYTLAASARANTWEAWLRPPLAYLPIGLLLLIAAGLGVA